MMKGTPPGDVAVTPPPLPRLPLTDGASRFTVGRVWCVGRNYAAHAREMGAGPVPEPPFFFLKPTSALLPGGGEVPWPPETEDLQHEVELVIALGRGGLRVPEESAEGLLFGFGVGIDLTRRDAQAEAKRTGRPWTLAKGFDFSAPCSALVPAERSLPLRSGRLRLHVNGALRQEGDIADQVWPVPALIARLSSLVELRPGDLIFTGTPAGVGSLVPGDLIEASFDDRVAISVRITGPR
ncbi:MAG: fumarylacetoacetate hydrolase family protein [Gemmatimonadota bacterium]